MWPRALLTVALRGPGKYLLLVSAAGWLTMAWLLTGDPSPHAAVVLHGGHATGATATPMVHVPSHFMQMWLAMVLAMGPPLLLREIGRLWRASLRRLRLLTIASFVCGYAGIWMLAGIALSMIFGWVAVDSWRIAGAIVLVVLWHCSPARQRCLNACHRVPTLRIFGTDAQLDALRYGVSTGCYCAATCGPLMVLVFLLKDYHLVAMVFAAVVSTLERHLPARRPGWRLPVVRGRAPDWPDMTRVTA